MSCMLIDQNCNHCPQENLGFGNLGTSSEYSIHTCPGFSHWYVERTIAMPNAKMAHGRHAGWNFSERTRLCKACPDHVTAQAL